MFEKTNVIALASLFVLTAFTGCLGSDTDEKITLEKLIVAYEVKEDYENPDENPQILAACLANKLDMEVELYLRKDRLLILLDLDMSRLLSWIVLLDLLVGNNMA